jgi:hypothetical protein
MTINEIIFDNNAIIRQQTTPNSINQDEVATQLDALANELLERGIAGAANTAAMSLLSGTNYKRAFVTNNGLFEWLSSGVVDGVHVFPATGGGVWSRITPITSAPMAVNGLSQDGSGQYVLGQDVGAAGDPAILTSHREIFLNAFRLRLRTNAAGQYLNIGQYPTNASFAGFGVEANSAGGKQGIFYINDAAPASAGSNLWFMTVANGEFQLNDNTGLFWRMTRTAIAGSFGSISAKLHMYHPVIDSAVDIGIGPLTGIRSRCVLTNRGATAGVIFTLPAFNAAITFFDITFAVVSPSGHAIRVQAPAGVTIRIGSILSAAGGTVTSTSNGDSVRLINLNATEWQAVAVVGSWTSP